jgi:hypothetical protein
VPYKGPSPQSLRALDWLNVFLADVRDGIGPYLAMYLLATHLVVAGLSIGTGRFNVTQGAIATAVGLGASISNFVAGYVVAAGGYNAAFLTLA